MPPLRPGHKLQTKSTSPSILLHQPFPSQHHLWPSEQVRTVTHTQIITWLPCFSSTGKKTQSWGTWASPLYTTLRRSQGPEEGVASLKAVWALDCWVSWSIKESCVVLTRLGQWPSSGGRALSLPCTHKHSMDQRAALSEKLKVIVPDKPAETAQGSGAPCGNQSGCPRGRKFGRWTAGKLTLWRQRTSPPSCASIDNQELAVPIPQACKRGRGKSLASPGWLSPSPGRTDLSASFLSALKTPNTTEESLSINQMVWACVGFFVTPWTVASQAPLSTGILQARILEWVAMPSSRGYSWPRDWTRIYLASPALAGGFFTTVLNWKPSERWVPL